MSNAPDPESGAFPVEMAVRLQVADYAGPDAELPNLAGQLLAEEAAFSARMSELHPKSRHLASMNIQGSCDAWASAAVAGVERHTPQCLR